MFGQYKKALLLLTLLGGQSVRKGRRSLSTLLYPSPLPYFSHSAPRGLSKWQPVCLRVTHMGSMYMMYMSCAGWLLVQPTELASCRVLSATILALPSSSSHWWLRD